MINYQQSLLYSVLRADLAPFIEKAFRTVNPGQAYQHNWHIELIADRLMQCYQGRINRLIITVPPRSLKSICTSVAFPAWLLGQDPSQRVICASYGQDLGAKHARDCRAVMQSDWYPRVFPQTRLERNAEMDLLTTTNGGRYTASVGGPLTGRGGQFIIIDDPLKPEDCTSTAKRNAVNQWYDGTLYSRLDNKQTGVIIIVMQRLHVDDLVAHVLTNEAWTRLDLPAIAEIPAAFNLAGGRVIERQVGDVLHPERESRAALDNIKNTIGSYNFSAQYQQQPVPEEGNLVRWSWFQFYESAPSLQQSDEIVQSWDTASKTSELSDYSVCTTWHIKGGQYYLLEVFRERLAFPDLQRAVVEQAKRFNARTVLIEDSASGTALIQNLRGQQIAGLSSPIPVKPEDDKVMRIHRQSAKIEAGSVHLPTKASWLDDFRQELLAFPYGAHDDQVDSMSQFLNWIDWRERRTIHVRKLIGF